MASRVCASSRRNCRKIWRAAAISCSDTRPSAFATQPMTSKEARKKVALTACASDAGASSTSEPMRSS
jgi:hypothetical protein